MRRPSVDCHQSEVSPVMNVDFWLEEADRLYWHRPFTRVVEAAATTPRYCWFPSGETNLCYNAVDRHLHERGSHTAIIHRDFCGQTTHISYQQLWEQVNALSALLREHGVKRGSLVVISLPMTPLAAAAMLACARLGAIHVVVYSGLTTDALVQRLDVCQPTLMLYCNDRRDRSTLPDMQCVLNQTNNSVTTIDTASEFFTESMTKYAGQRVPCCWVESSHPSHLLFTSGTTGKPKGIVRDTGGYAVALLASMHHLFRIDRDEVFFSTADVGWVTGHSYGIYAPLLAGITTVMCETNSVNSPGESWWQMVESQGITRLLTIAGAIRLARQQGKPRASLDSLKCLYLAGEPLDKATQQWLSLNFPVPLENHYWQTESGWPLLAGNGVGLSPVFSRSVSVINSLNGKQSEEGEIGMLVVHETLGPGGMTTLWQDDAQHDQKYWFMQEGKWYYTTQDCAVVNQGKIQILGRMDDVINIGGQRLTTAEVENALIGMDGVIEVAATREPHLLLGEMVRLYIVSDWIEPEAIRKLRKSIREKVTSICGRFAQPRHIIFMSALPKTFSGKVIRRQLVTSQLTANEKVITVISERC